MTLDRFWRRWMAPRWLPLLLDAALVSLFLLLDVRDLWFKLRWVGPRDAFAFSTIETLKLPTSGAAPLQPTTAFSYADQKAQRVSGWSSFLEKCEILTPLLEESEEDKETPGFRYAVGKNCMVGASSSPVRVPELLITSNTRVDSMAWTACELLYKHRKPPICHSEIVTGFRERYSLQNEIDLSIEEPARIAPGNTEAQDSYAAKPGSEEEMELIELLQVISKSSPVSAVVCVEGFILKGSGRYTATTYGCGSPSFYRSVFVGGDTFSFAQFQRDKGWLNMHTLRVLGMQFLIRENRRSTFKVQHATTGPAGERLLHHMSKLNYSASGTLYTLMILSDLTLLVLYVSGIVEIARFMLWPLWKPLVASEYQTSSARTTKMGFGVEDYARVLQIGLIRSPPVAFLTILSRRLIWTLVIPSASLWRDGHFGSGDVHAFLTMIRFCDLVVVCVNASWNMVVAYKEKRALWFVRGTYITPLEITSIATAVAIAVLPSMVPQINGSNNRQQLTDRVSFENTTAIANAFPAHPDSFATTTTLELYHPLLSIIGISVFVVGVIVVSRFSAGKATTPSLVQSLSDTVPVTNLSALKGSPSFHTNHSDLTSCSAGILMRTASSRPPPSPTRMESRWSLLSPAPAASNKSGDRLSIEKMVDIPIRARSLVRSSWILDKLVDGQLRLLPPSYLKYGIVLVGKSMKTRCGFMDVVQPLVHTKEHEKPNELEKEPQQMSNNNSRPNLR